ncbi:MAG: hypothetical protein ACTHNN_05555 [Xanthobacteraceae bacterium]
MTFLGFDINWSAQTWAAVASAIAAWVAFALSLFNLRTSQLALRISEAQESRRKPSIASYLQDAYITVGARPSARVYAVLVSLSNKSDNDNGIASTALHLTYAKKGGLEFTVKVSPEDPPPSFFADKSAKHLQVPFRIDAHQIVSGWAFFAVENAILEGASIKGTRFAFIDAHENETVVEPLNVREYSNVFKAHPTEEVVPKTTGAPCPHSG